MIDHFNALPARSRYIVRPLARYSRNGRILRSKKCFASYRTPDENIDGDLGARPIYFQQSPISNDHHPKTTKADRNYRQEELLSRSLTPYEFLGTASVLPPHARHLSPCLGAALATSPLAGNLMRLGQRQPYGSVTMDGVPEGDAEDMDRSWAELLSRIGFLANNLFFQLIRESPIHMVRNKSMPAAYLTPEIIGCLISHQHQQSVISQTAPSNRRDGSRKQSDPNAILKSELKHYFGIKSNHIYHTQWTGISLARWMDLVVPANNSEIDSTASSMYALYQQSLVSALWLIALWGVTPSKKSLVGYYEAVEKAGIICSHQAIGIATTDSFTEDNFAPKKLEAAMNRLLEYYSPEKTSEICDDVVARDFELICGAIVLQQHDGNSSSQPPPIPNGYYAFDGGDTKADCAEVVVREILTLLLWDETKGKMDISRLPSPPKKLLRFLHRLDQTMVEGSIVEEEEEMKTKKQKDLGQAWFDLLSDLSYCDYLAESPNGRAFELAPTSESISRALWHLLVGCNDKQTQIAEQPWTSLDDLSRYWSQHHKSKPLFVRHERLKHKSGDSSTGIGTPIIMEHELISLHLHGHSRVIEIRLRCDFKMASGLAAVTHLTIPRQKRLLDPRQVQKLQDICFRDTRDKNRQVTNTGFHSCRDPSLVMLCLALQHGQQDLFLPHRHDNSMATFGSLAWLASSYGADRRELKAPIQNDDYDYDSLEEDFKILERSCHLLKERIFQVCRICDTHPLFGSHLLSWILQESPIVVETSSSLLKKVRDNGDMDILSDAALIEQALLSLPASILNNDSVLEAIDLNWDFIHRRKLLARIIRLKGRKLSFWQAFSQSKLHEIPEMISLASSLKQRK